MIFAVSCVKGITEAQDDFDSQSVQTEFFTSSEMDEILLGFRRFGFMVRAFFSEDDFIQFVHSPAFRENHHRYKLVYNTAHSGTGPGRKALLPSFCALHKIPITGSDAYCVSLARHKFHVACLLQHFDLPAPETWFYLPHYGWLDAKRPQNGSRVIAKLTYESASIGLDSDSAFTVDHTMEARLNYLANSFRQPVTVQAFVSGWEVEVPVIVADRYYVPMAVGISKNERRLLGDTFLTYHDVFADDYGFWCFEENSANLARLLENTAARVAALLGLKGFARIDYRISKDGAPFITDISTSPHITSHSSYGFLFNILKRDLHELPVVLAATASQREQWI